MRRFSLAALGAGVLVLCLALSGSTLGITSPAQAAGTTTPQGPPGQVLKLLAVGSVLTADGRVWLYRPDRGRWLTIDEAFGEEQRETHVLPLPVPATSIKEMITFGFLLTDTGDCWLYLVDSDKWAKLPPPAAGPAR